MNSGTLPVPISVTVCVRNGSHFVDECLDSLSVLSPPPLEVLIVDDGSTDETPSVIENWMELKGVSSPVPFKVLTQPQKGLSAARQFALEESKGEWVAITDIDCRPQPDWLAGLLLAVNNRLEGENVVAVTGRTIFETGTNMVSRIRAFDIASKYRSRPRTTSLANGPCSMLNKEATIAVGGFDKDWYHAEDMEVSLRLLESEGTIIYAPNAIVNHVAEDSIGVFLKKRKRDARAHMRIVRAKYQRRVEGLGFDFLGRSFAILFLIPLFFSMVATAIFSCIFGEHEVYLWGATLVQAILMLLSPLLLMPNGVLFNGEYQLFIPRLIKTSTILVLWSFALWQGLLLGSLDALLGRHGHRKLFKRTG